MKEVHFRGEFMSTLTFRERFHRLFVLIVYFFLPIAFFFQNCSSGFETIKDNSQLKSLDPALFSVPQISFVDAKALTNTPNYTLQFTISSLAKIKSATCQLNVDVPVDCSLLAVTYSNLVDGDYNIKVAVETEFGIKNEALMMFRKDSTLPVITVAMKPTATTNLVTAAFVFNVADNLSGVDKIECSLDAAAYAACVSPANLVALIAGNHNFKIRAYDKASNKSLEYTYNWVIDLTVPTVSFTQMPLALTSLNTATFAFSGAGIVTYECALDAAAYAACTSPHVLVALTAGVHIFKVRGTNAAASVSLPIMFTWTVDNVAPTLPVLTTNVLALTLSKSILIGFASVDAGSGVASYDCTLDTAAFATCTNPKEFTNLAEGKHQIKARAKDNAGNISAEATFIWTIDLTAPTIIFVTVPAKISALSSSNFTFTITDASPLASVMCYWTTAVQTSKPIDCRNGAFNLIAPFGGYVFHIQAEDTLGNKSTAHYGWDRDDNLGVISKYKSIKAGYSHMCGITLDDRVQCWGMRNYDASNSGASPVAFDVPNLSDVKALSIGYHHNCALLNSSRIYCWGLGGPALEGDKGLSGVLAVATGGAHSCALMNGGSVKCWGNNSEGQLGNGNQINSDNPVNVLGITGAKSLSLGYDRTCVITNDEKVKCWGSNSNIETGTLSLVPVEIPGLTGIKYLDVGFLQAKYYEACAIDNQNITKCWVSSVKEVTGLPQVKSLAINSNKCAITNQDKVWCWGSNLSGEIGNQDENSIMSEVYGLENIKEIAKGTSSTCALAQDGTVRCWGANYSGELGHNSMTETTRIQDFLGLTNVKTIAGNLGRYCVLTYAGTVKCWGRGYANDGFNRETLIPESIVGINGAKSVAAGNAYSCAQTDMDNVMCWGGYNNNIFLNPTLIPGFGKVKSVSSGENFVCAVLESGESKCFGYNFFGSLGNNTALESFVPVNVINISDAVSVVSSRYANCALTASSTVKCWGLGFGATAIEIPGLAGLQFKSIVASGGGRSFVGSGGGGSWFCGITSANETKCWNGKNVFTNWDFGRASTLISIGGYYSDFSIWSLNDSGSLVRKGDNSFGQLGQPVAFPLSSDTEPLALGKPIIDVHSGNGATYFIYADKTVGMVGRKYEVLRGPSSVLKSPR